MPAEHGTEDNASGIEMPHLDKEVAVLGKQTARCKQWASRLKRLHSIQHSGAPSNSPVGTLHKLNLEATRCICKDLDLTNAYECEMKSVIFSLNGSHPSHYIQVRRLADHFSKRVQDALKAKKKADDEQVKAAFKNDKHHSKAFRLLSNAVSSPITFLRRAPVASAVEEGTGTKGAFATNPAELDFILTSAWQKIYQGSVRSMQETAACACASQRRAGALHLSRPSSPHLQICHSFYRGHEGAIQPTKLRWFLAQIWLRPIGLTWNKVSYCDHSERQSGRRTLDSAIPSSPPCHSPSVTVS